eukprot:COSAG03_NODE_14649_length_457_cov_0.508380_1_plen_147_part_10
MDTDILDWGGVRFAIVGNDVGALRRHVAADGSRTLVDGDGCTVYHCCVGCDKPECLQYVLDSSWENLDAVATGQAWKGLTALMIAAAWGRKECAELLVRGGVDVEAVGSGGDNWKSKGLTAVAIAEKNGHAEVARAIQAAAAERAAA